MDGGEDEVDLHHYGMSKLLRLLHGEGLGGRRPAAELEGRGYGTSGARGSSSSSFFAVSNLALATLDPALVPAFSAVRRSAPSRVALKATGSPLGRFATASSSSEVEFAAFSFSAITGTVVACTRGTLCTAGCLRLLDTSCHGPRSPPSSEQTG